MYGIWDCVLKDWVREMPSKVDYGGFAILVFENKQAACQRAAKHFFFRTYSAAKKSGACFVRSLFKRTTDEQQQRSRPD